MVRITNADTGEEIAVGPERIQRVTEVNGKTLFTYHGPARNDGGSELIEIFVKENKANINAQLANTSVYF
jgi:hypothetical protein